MSDISRDKRNAFLRYLPWLAGLVLLAFAAWYFTRPAPLRVQLAKVERGLVEATVSNTRAGTVKACRRAKLAPPAGGQIAHLLVKKGQRVKANQVLLELWNNDLEAQAASGAGTTRHGADPGTAGLCAGRSGGKGSRARAATQGEGIHFRRRAGSKGIRCQGEPCRLRGRAQPDRPKPFRIVAWRHASLSAWCCARRSAGIIADISGELGEYATPSPPGIPTPPAIDLIDDSCMFVSAPIDEVDAADIKVGQEARITLDAIKGKTFAGKVKRIAPYVLELEKQARTVEVEVDFDERPNAENLLVGYSADVEIVHDYARERVAHPHASAARRQACAALSR